MTEADRTGAGVLRTEADGFVAGVPPLDTGTIGAGRRTLDGAEKIVAGV
jgi:hypothetical protein